MADGKITIGGEEVDVGGLCLNFDLARFAGMPGAHNIQEAFAKVRDGFSILVPNYVENALTQIAQAIGLPDMIWTGNGPGLPALAAGGVDGPTVLGHINNYAGIGAQPPAIGPLGVAPAGANLTVMTDMRVDPPGHVVINPFGGMQQGYAAKPFTCQTPWISYNLATDVVAHGTTAAAGAVGAFGAAGNYLVSLCYDGRNHVVAATSAAMPATSYTAGNAWISINEPARTIWHATTAAATGAHGAAGNYIISICYDAQNHVITATSAALPAGGSYTASNNWIYIDEPARTIGHTYPNPDPAAAGSAVAGAASAIAGVYWDSYHHVVSASYRGVLVGGSLPWISISAGNVVHSTTAAPGGLDHSYLSASAAISAVYFDAQNHAISAAYAHLRLTGPGNGWISIEETLAGDYSVHHSLPNPHVTSNSYDAGAGSAIRTICYDQYHHITGITTIAV